MQSVTLTTGSSEKARAEERQRGVSHERPEKGRRLQSFTADDVPREPADRRHREQDLSGGDGKLRGGDQPDERHPPNLFEAIAWG